jgi:predicted transcriptional regulator
MELPSLMFFLKSGGKSVVQSFLRNIMRDMLFLIQFIICIALLLIPSQPYNNTTINLAAEHVVFVIDTSASSQATADGGTRLDLAISQAKGMLGKKNTIILAKGTPEVLTREVGSIEANKALDTIKATDTGSRIGEAMLLAGQALQGDGRIIVLSDFDNTDGVAPTTAKNALESRGQNVALVNLGNPVENIGFIDLNVGEDATVAYVRNFKKQQAIVTLHIGEATKQLTIAADGIEPIRFKTPPGITELKLDTGDAYPADDIAYVSAPEEAKIKVLLISKQPSRFLRSALTSSPRIDLAVSEPPIISKEKYDVYVIDNVNAKDVLPGTYQDILQRAQDGSGVVITAQQGMASINYGKLLPIIITGDGKNTYVRTDQDVALTRNLDFGNVKAYIQARPVDGAISIASATDNSTIITLKAEGAGMVAYYGLLEDQSEFKLQPDYPIFWQNLMRVMAQRVDVRELNKLTGETLAVDSDTQVEGPDGKRLDGPLIPLEHRGTYTIGDRTLAVNGLDARESNLLTHPEITGDAENAGSTVKEQRQFNWELTLIIIGAAFLLFEIIFLKVRGDI